MDDRSSFEVDAEESARNRFAAESAAFYIREARRALGTYVAIFNAGSSGKQNETASQRLTVVGDDLQSHYDKCVQVCLHVSQVFESVSLAYTICHKVIEYYMQRVADELPEPKDFSDSKIREIKSDLTTLGGYVDWHKNGTSSLPNHLKEFESIALLGKSEATVSMETARLAIKELTLTGVMVLVNCPESKRNTLRRWLTINNVPKTCTKGAHRYCAIKFFEAIDATNANTESTISQSLHGSPVKTTTQKTKFALTSEIKKSDYEKVGYFFFGNASK